MFLYYRFLPKKISDFFTGVVKETYDHRKKTGEQRNDFIQQILNDNAKGDKPGNLFPDRKLNEK
jgi:hypothetical protein